MRHSPRKRFGQNFLQSRQVIEQIVKAIHPLAKDKLLEIGPGMGALTEVLLGQVPQLHAIEIDRDLYQYLGQLPLAQDKLHLILADALTVDYSQFGSDLRVIGNLPYNISTPLLFYLMSFLPYIQDMHFMLQKEVVDRMAAAPGSKAYGRLSLMLQYQCEIEHLFDVPAQAFDPPPKVTSAFVRLKPLHSRPELPVAQLAQVVSQAFSMRRKTLINNLKILITADQLSALGIEASKRPEQISLFEYVQIAKFIFN